MISTLALPLQWVQWLRSWSHDPVAVGGNTALLLVRAMECCSGRYISVADRNVNHLDEYSQLEQLTHSICCKLTSRVLAQVCTCMHATSFQNYTTHNVLIQLHAYVILENYTILFQMYAASYSPSQNDSDRYDI